MCANIILDLGGGGKSLGGFLCLGRDVGDLHDFNRIELNVDNIKCIYRMWHSSRETFNDKKLL